MSTRIEALRRLNRIRLRHLWRYIRARKEKSFPLSDVRGLFSWNWGFVLFFFASAVTIIGIGVAVEPFEYLFGLARLFFVLCLISAVGWWLTSKQLEKRKPRVTRKQKKHGERVSYVGYRIWKWGVAGLMVLVVGYALNVTAKVELSRELSLDHGWLMPANDLDPPNNCSFEISAGAGTGRTIKLMPDNALKVFLGKVMVSYSSFPHNIFTVNKKNPLVLNRDQSGRIALTMDILDRDGKVVVRFTDGFFTVNQNARLEMKRPNRNTLIVNDNYGNEVLNIRYVNKKAVVVSALLQYSHAKPVQIQKTQFADVCLGDVGYTGINFDSPE